MSELSGSDCPLLFTGLWSFALPTKLSLHKPKYCYMDQKPCFMSARAHVLVGAICVVLVLFGCHVRCMDFHCCVGYMDFEPSFMVTVLPKGAEWIEGEWRGRACSVL